MYIKVAARQSSDIFGDMVYTVMYHGSATWCTTCGDGGAGP